ncbi:MAG: hypothetical protein CMJ83_03260 [Planctomycetes bacterium]|nr:hypothetical protein [Planctomycetota bacterium]
MKLLILIVIAAASLPAQDPPTSRPTKGTGWIEMFNGKDLTGWTPKIRGYALGENFGNTFRVEKGVLKVAYDAYEKFDRRFGHLFYAHEYGHYLLRLDYRFTGKQVKGGPGWALRNSGIMVHGQAAKSMGKNQDFPASIEIQLLGGNGKDERSTCNLCTPGTNVVMKDKLVRRHCINSKSKTYHGEQWITVEIEVKGSEVIRHKIDGQVVLEYQKPQLDPRDSGAQALIEAAKGELLLSKGTISLQSESHPCEFRNLRIKPLDVKKKGPPK